MRRIALAVFAFFVFSTVSAFAQKTEVSLDASLFVFYPAKGLTGARNLYGGGGSFVYNFRKHIGFKSEFQGYLSSTAKFHLNPPTVPSSTTVSSQANLFTYMFGPQVSFAKQNVRVFGEALFGGAHTNTYANFQKASGVTGVAPSNNGFAMAFGGGVDLGISAHVAFRLAELDYVRTQYNWEALGFQHQNSVRYQSGVVFAWGE